MKKLLLGLILLTTPVFAQNDSLTASIPVKELSSASMQKVSNTQFTQVKSVQVTYDYNQLLQARQNITDRIDRLNTVMTSLQSKLTDVNSMISTMEAQGAKATVQPVSKHHGLNL